jgi:hypothetical protein
LPPRGEFSLRAFGRLRRKNTDGLAPALVSAYTRHNFRRGSMASIRVRSTVTRNFATIFDFLSKTA